jgi:cell division protein FtsQ
MIRRKQPVKTNRRVSKSKLQKRKAVFREQLSDVAVFVYRPKLFFVVMCVLLVAVAYQQLNMRTVLPISSVKIEGEFKYLDKEQLREQVMPVVDGGFFSVDLVTVRNALIELPWVEDASVRRQWPDQLLVRVMEKQPVVFWGEDAVLSSKGDLFSPGRVLNEQLPRMNGPEGLHATMFKELARMQAWLLQTGLYIREMNLDARRSWTLIMENGIELRLGRNNMYERLQRFASVYRNNFQSETRKIEHIDMRYTNGFAVAWKEA